MVAVASCFAQILALIDRTAFARAVRQHAAERAAKGFSCWDHFVAMLLCQMGSAHSLREICGGLATALGKYWVCKRAPGFVNEAQECLGGAGYVEESGLPRLYRQAPLNSIWEGSGNIQCLDLLRVLAREPESAAALFDELESAKGGNTVLDAEVLRLRQDLRAEPAALEAGNAPLHAYFVTSGSLIVTSVAPPAWAAGKTIDTPFVSVPGLLTAKCATNDHATYLEVTVNGDPSDPRIDDIPGDLGVPGKPVPMWGLHLIDVNLVMGNLLANVELQTRAYLRR